ncbi:MAG: helix-turn-helix transcriptional regulator [Ruminococcus sp.]|jgi:transcriptional regulator with XRE-family HTH domain|nr:helix-turn-helix transcriptional regulator [Ruminococcus sp.]
MNVTSANRLFALRAKHNLTPEELAKILSCSPDEIKAWERAESSPSLEQIVELSRLYNVSADEIAGTVKSTPMAGNTVSLKKKTFTGGIGVDYNDPYPKSPMRELRPSRYTDEEIYPEFKTTFKEPEAAEIPHIKTAETPPHNTGNTIGGKLPVTAANILRKTGEIIDMGVNELKRNSGPVADTVKNVAKEVGKGIREGKEEFVSKNTRPQGFEYVSPEPGAYDEEMNRTYQTQVKSYYEQKLDYKFQKKQDKLERKKERLKRKQEMRDSWNNSSLFHKVLPWLCVMGFFASIPIGEAIGLELVSVSWMLFLVTPIFYSLEHSIKKRDFRFFPFWLVGILAYVFTCILFNNGVPGLPILGLIPLAHILASHFYYKNNN